jgi:predicted secreted hydrolase
MRKTTAGAAVAAASALIISASLAMAGPATATVAAIGSARGGVASTSFPVFVDPVAGLTANADRPNESWYVIAHVTAGGHRYGLLAHYLSNGTATQGTASSAVSITDETTGWYTRSEVALPPRAGLSGRPGVDIHTQNITWTGDATQMQLHATVPQGRIDVTLRPQGNVLYNLATGYFPMFADPQYPNYEYAFPTIDTTGTLTLNGRTEQVHGQSWMDRQWGPLPADLMDGHAGWTWMDLNLSNGDKISLWRTLHGSEHTWATILSPDGTHTVAAATITADPAARWTSPTSGQTFNTHWKVTVPDRHATLDVRVTTKNQELLTPGPRYEGSATVTGTYQGHRISGYTYVEQAGLQ